MPATPLLPSVDSNRCEIIKRSLLFVRCQHSAAVVVSSSELVDRESSTSLPRDALVRLHCHPSVCRSVCDVGGSGSHSHRLEIN